MHYFFQLLLLSLWLLSMPTNRRSSLVSANGVCIYDRKI
jgi:hypothetical protein